jgi:glycosyltransferase involved in cell wall biosynthesis
MNGKKLHVLYISSWYPNKVRPLLGIFIKRHAQALVNECDIASLYAYADETESINEAIEDGVYTVRVAYKKVKSSIPVLSSFMKLKRYNDAWKKAITLYVEKKGKPDIVNLNVIIPAANVAMYIKRKWNVPYVITEHWTGYFPEDGRYRGFLMKRITEKAVKNASAVVTVSNDLKNQMLKVGLDNDYHIISNVVDTEIFNVLKSKVRTDKIKFVHVSALDNAQKNISGIINVFKRIHSAFPNTELTIVGDGTERNWLEELGKSSGAIHFVGQKEKGELAEILQSSDAFVLFSNYETQAIVLLEALCCGIPVIATKAGGISEYVNGRNGILIDAKNEEQLFEAMSMIVKNRDKFNSPEDIRASVADKVNAKAIAKQFIEVYNKVLNTR